MRSHDQNIERPYYQKDIINASTHRIYDPLFEIFNRAELSEGLPLPIRHVIKLRERDYWRRKRMGKEARIPKFSILAVLTEKVIF